MSFRGGGSSFMTFSRRKPTPTCEPHPHPLPALTGGAPVCRLGQHFQLLPMPRSPGPGHISKGPDGLSGNTGPEVMPLAGDDKCGHRKVALKRGPGAREYGPQLL